MIKFLEIHDREIARPIYVNLQCVQHVEVYQGWIKILMQPSVQGYPNTYSVIDKDQIKCWLEAIGYKG